MKSLFLILNALYIKCMHILLPSSSKICTLKWKCNIIYERSLHVRYGLLPSEYVNKFIVLEVFPLDRNRKHLFSNSMVKHQIGFHIQSI